MNDLPAPVSIIPSIESSEFALSIYSDKPARTPLLSGFTGGLSTSSMAIFP